MVRIDQARLERLLQDFNILTGFRIGVFDSEGRELCGCPATLSGFCAALRTWPAAAARCARCDREAFQKAAQAGRFLTYRCHAGLVEALTPLTQAGEPLGYLMIGQLVASQPGQDPWHYTEQAIKAAGASPAELRPFFDLLAKMDPARIHAAFDIFELCAQYMIRNEIVRQELPAPEEKLRTALRPDSKVDSLARDVGVGRTSLYKLARQSFGEPVGVHVRSLRLTEAKKLLARPELPIAGVAAALGMQSATYFARWFRKNTGLAPTEFRHAATLAGHAAVTPTPTPPPIPAPP